MKKLGKNIYNLVVESGIKGLLEKIKTLDVKKHLKLLDKILSFIVKLYYVILLIILISLVYFIVTSTENIYKALLSIVIIILLVMLRFTRKYMKRIMAEINTVRDMKEDEKLKKELIFYITFQLFMSLILTNISLFVFFGVNYYIFNTNDYLEISRHLIGFLDTIKMFNETRIFRNIFFLIVTLFLYYFIIRVLIRGVDYMPKMKRTKEEIEEDKQIIKLARQILPKGIRLLLKKRTILNYITFFSFILMMKFVQSKGDGFFILIFIVSYICQLLIGGYVGKGDRKIKEYLWYRSYKPNPGPDEDQYRKKIKRVYQTKKKVTGGFGARKSMWWIIGGLGGIGGGVIAGQGTGDFFVDSEKRMYPPKKWARKIGDKIIERTGGPEDEKPSRKD